MRSAVFSQRFTPMWNPDFRRLLVARLVTTMGTWGTFIAVLTIYVFETELGPLLVGMFALVQLVPNLFIDPFASVITDWFSRRRILVVTKVLNGLVILVLLFENSLLLAYAVLFLLQLLAAFSGPAAQALLPQVVSEDELAQANGLLSGGNALARIIAPGFAAAVIALAGAYTVFVIDAITYWLSAAFIVSMTEYKVDREDERSVRSDFWEGISYVRNSVTLVLSLTIGLLLSAAAGVINAMMPIYIREVLQGGGVLYGSLLSIAAAGAILAGLVISGSRRTFKPLSRAALGLSVSGLALVGFALTYNPLLVAGIMLIAGLARATTVIFVRTQIQQSAPEEVMGRSFGIYSAAAGGGRFSSIVLGSLLVAWVGVIPVFAGVGGILALSGAGLLMAKV